MQHTSALIIAALAAVAQAIRFDFPGNGFTPVTGEPITLNFSEGVPGDTATITLKNGPSSNLQEVEVIGTVEIGEDGTGSFTWTPSDVVSGTYALEISDSEDENWSPQFTLVGDTTTTIETSTTTATSTSTTETSATTTDESSTITTTTMGNSTTLSTSMSSTSTGKLETSGVALLRKISLTRAILFYSYYYL